MSTLFTPPTNGLLLPQAFDPWAGAGLLGLPARSTPIQAEPQTLRSFIAEAYPRYGFHRWADVLIDLLQQVADVSGACMQNDLVCEEVLSITGRHGYVAKFPCAALGKKGLRVE